MHLTDLIKRAMIHEFGTDNVWVHNGWVNGLICMRGTFNTHKIIDNPEIKHKLVMTHTFVKKNIRHSYFLQ